MKKVILLVIVLSLVLSMTVNAVTFTDISDHWAKGYIERVAKNGLVAGYENKTFKPDNNVTVLESLVMMSRLYDIDEDLREQIVEKYESKFDSMINTKGYDWSFEYLSVIIELGVVSEKGIDDMFAKKTIMQDATREEVAVLLTKAMLLGKEAQDLKVYSLPFNDRDKISAAARPYVYIMYDKEIMQGDDKKNVNPTNKITRAEIATVIDKAYDYVQDEDVYPEFDNFVKTTVESGIISQLSTTKNDDYIYIKNESGKENIIKIDNGTKITINNRSRDFSDLKKDMIVNCKIDEDRVAVSIEVDNSKEVKSGRINLVAYASPASLTIIDADKDKVQYKIPSDAKVYLDGKEVELRKLSKNDDVTLLLEEGKVYQVNAISRIKEYEGVISKINYSKYPITISVETKNGQEMTFEFNSFVEVTRNDKASSFDRVRVGDEVTVTTEYDEMIAINTVAREAEINGTINEIILGSVSKLKIANEDGDVDQYTISKNVIVTIGDKTASVNDLRVGYNVYINTSGGEIVTIDASELQAVINFSGKIIYVNEKDKVIMMQNTSGGSSQAELIYLNVTNSTKIINISGDTRYMKNLEEGQYISSTAISQNGEYVAVTIIIP